VSVAGAVGADHRLEHAGEELGWDASKPTAPQADAAEKNCEKQARKALGLP
jgi:hypothetical protein